MGARLCAPDIPPKEDTVPNRTLDDVNPNPMIAEVRRVSHVASDLNDEAEYFIEILTQRCIDENLPPWKIDVQRRTTIAELKQKVAAESGEEPVTMQLYYEHIGRLRDELRLEDYGIEWGTRLYPIARPSKHLFCRCMHIPLHCPNPVEAHAPHDQRSPLYLISVQTNYVCYTWHTRTFNAV